MKRPLFYSGLAMFCAILACEITKNFFPSAAYIPCAVISAAAVAGGLCFFGLFLKKKQGRALTLGLICLFCVIGCVGWYGVDSAIAAAKAEFITQDGKPVETSLRVVSDPRVSGAGTSAEAESDGFPYKVRVYFPASVRVKMGDKVKGKFTFSNLYNESFYRSDRIIMYVRASSDCTVTSSSPSGVTSFVLWLQGYIEEASGRIFGTYSPFVESITLGGSDRLSETRRTDLRQAGLLHVTCVSGLHISILISFMTLLFGRLKNDKLSFLLTAMAVLVILLLCAFSPSSVRASMTGLTMLAYRKSPNRPDGLNLLGLPLTVLLLYNPLYAVDVSFLLSFSAVAGIHLFYDRIYGSLITRVTAESGKIPSKPLRLILQSFALSLVCTVATAPVSMIFFRSAVTASVISGVVCLWAVTPIYVFSVICILLYPLPFADFIIEPLAFTVKKGVSFIMNISEILSEFDISGIDLSDFKLSDISFENFNSNFAMWFAIFIAAIFIILLFRPFKNSKAKAGKPGAGWILLLVGAVLIGAYFIRDSRTDGVIDSESVTVGFIDVGQGNCAVVIQGDQTAVIDCGGDADPGEAAIDFIRQYGDGEIDTVILSHLHADHVNGLADLCAEFDVGVIYIPYTEGDETYEDQIFTVAEMMGAVIREVDEDTTVSLGKADLNMLTDHLNHNHKDQNDNSIVTRLSMGDFSVLFTGDITKNVEDDFIEYYPFVTATVLGVPHHGSKHSSTEEFIASISPDVSVISVSDDNSYGHPTPEAVERLSKYSEVLTTKDSGTIRIVSDGYDYEIYVTEQ